MIDLLLRFVDKSTQNTPKKLKLARLSTTLFLVGMVPILIMTFTGLIFAPSLSLLFLLCIGAVLVSVALFVLLAIWAVWDAVRGKDKQSQLVRQIRSGTNKTAKAAVNALRADGTLSGDAGWLIGVDLSQASLRFADLHGANLNRTGLEHANLRKANLFGANLRSARLNYANLSQADLSQANLRYANLQNANLRNARLCDADMMTTDLQNARLEGANLRGARFEAVNLQGAHFDEYTILPNGHRWTLHTDLTRFGETLNAYET